VTPNSRLLEPGAQARITEAVSSAEARTIGQIVPVVVDRSDHYPEAPLRAALLGAAAAAGILYWFSDLGPSASLIVTAGTALLGVGLALAVPGLRRRLIGGRLLDERVHHRALRAFMEHGVYRTSAETGVLLFASLFERRVVIIGDRAIHEKMGENGWRQAVAVLTAGLQRGEPEEGFLQAIGSVGEALAASFPRSATPGSNELSDDLRVDRSE
jgi:putative membrane protein